MTDKSAREIVAAYIQNKVIVDDGSWSNGWPTAYMITDDILAALEAGGFELARKHKWFKPDWMDHECCQDCGIVRRADDRHRPCLGPVRVGLRPHMPLKDEYTESLVASNPKEEGR